MLNNTYKWLTSPPPFSLDDGSCVFVLLGETSTEEENNHNQCDSTKYCFDTAIVSSSSWSYSIIIMVIVFCFFVYLFVYIYLISHQSSIIIIIINLFTTVFVSVSVDVVVFVLEFCCRCMFCCCCCCCWYLLLVSYYCHHHHHRISFVRSFVCSFCSWYITNHLLAWYTSHYIFSH